MPIYREFIAHRSSFAVWHGDFFCSKYFSSFKYFTGVRFHHNVLPNLNLNRHFEHCGSVKQPADGVAYWTKRPVNIDESNAFRCVYPLLPNLLNQTPLRRMVFSHNTPIYVLEFYLKPFYVALSLLQNTTICTFLEWIKWDICHLHSTPSWPGRVQIK